ncbi:MAG: hypothetical protein QNK37_08610 [Acidobacteriota bacterium]|nr:hypothetical protein [Acidobacteriota bacterium]
MIFYPSEETKTNRRGIAWASLILVAASILGYALIVVPLTADYQADLERTERAFWEAVDRQYQSGTLDNDFLVSVRQDPDIAGLAENRGIFSEEVRKAYRTMTTQSLPMERLSARGNLGKLSVIISPSSLLILIPGCLALWLMGFVLEHRYDRQLALALFILSGFLWVFLEDRVPAPWWPAPVFAWMWTVTVFLWVGWLSSPGASVIVTVRAWFGASFKFTPAVPTLYLCLGFTAIALAYAWFGPYAALFRPESLTAVLMEAGIFSLVFIFFAPKEKVVDDDPESLVNQQISAAEVLYRDERYEEATHVLSNLLDHNPDMDQLGKMINLAWHQDETEVVERCYAALLKKAVATNDFYRILTVVDEMVLRRIPVPGRSLLNLVNISLRQELVKDALKLLPYLRESNQVEKEDIITSHERLAEILVRQQQPDYAALKEIYAWIAGNHPKSETLGLIKTCFGKRKASKAETRLVHRIRIEKVVNVELFDVGISHLELRIPGKKMQRVPWTAVLGLFGCHMSTENRGLRGCIVIKFQRRVFGCIFSPDSIQIKDSFGRIMSFEETWNKLQEQVPGDLSFLKMKDFQQIPTEAAFESGLSAFMNAGQPPQTEIA